MRPTVRLRRRPPRGPRRTSTRARCRRYSLEALRSDDGSVPSPARAAASAAEAPSASAASTAAARSGTEPMFTRPIDVEPLRTATTPTIAQSWARRLNFWNDQVVPRAFGIADLGEHLVGRAAPSRGSPGGTATPGPRARRRDRGRTNVPPRASTAAGRSEAASPCAMRAADRAPMADLGVADLAGDVGEHRGVRAHERVGLEVAVARERADGEVVAAVADVGELAHPADVDEHAPAWRGAAS